jgi:hypothetical protein
VNLATWSLTAGLVVGNETPPGFFRTAAIPAMCGVGGGVGLRVVW